MPFRLRSDTNTALEHGSTSGNVLLNDSEAIQVTQAKAGSGSYVTVTSAGTIFQGLYGRLTLRLDGSYFYTADLADRLKKGATATDTFTYDAVGGNNSGSTTLKFTVTGVNDAPVLTSTSVALPTITEDQTTNGGRKISAFLASTDVDSTLRGIAITGLNSGNGQWQYSINGGSSWTAIGTVNDGSALLLRGVDYIRFVPNGLNGTTADFTFRAWDQSSGVAGTKADATINGGESAFSTATGTASIVVSEVNNDGNSAPVGVASSASGTEDGPPVTGRVEATDPEGSTLTYALVANSAVGGTVSINSATGDYSFTPAEDFSGTASFRFTASDGSLTSSPTTVTVTIAAVNDSPVGVASSASGTENGPPITGQVEATDVDDATLTYALVEDSAVGGAVSIDPNTGDYVFTPAEDFSGTASFQFTASDGDLSSPSTLVTITIPGVNDAPVLTATTASLPTITEDQTANNGQTIASFLSSTDADANALRGIALTGLTSGNGQWQYSTNAGSTWTAVGGVADGAALLLRSNDLIRFVPNGVDGTAADFTYRAWDQTSGTVGTKVDATANGGQTAFSTATGTASIVVSSVNDAPVGVASSASGTENGPPITGQVEATDVDDATLTYALVEDSAVGGAVSIDPNTGDYVFTPAEDFSGTASFQFTASDGDLSSPSTLVTITIPGVNDAPVLTATTASLPTITEDQTANNGQTIASFLSSTDADANALRGIALTGLTSGNGQWQYSTNAGSTWTAVGGVADGAALLLRSNDLIRFVPNGVDGTAADFTYRAWDQTSGTVGTKVDATANGGQTAFSTATGTASIVVSSVNDAPVGVASSASGTENGPPITGQVEATDVDDATLTYALVEDSAVGGAVSIDPNTGDYVFTPAEDFSGTASFQFTASDGDLSSPSTLVTITIPGVNDAPVLTATTASLPTITEDQTANNGQTIASFLSSTDADANALRGIALTGLTSGNGQWQYSTNAGSTWTAVGGVADGAALLLRSNDLIRFVPNGVDGTAADFTYRAWDQTSGTVGTKVDATANGGQTAFSTATGTASIVVSSVNDAPVGVASSASGTENGPPITGQVEATDVDDATLTYALVEDSAVGGAVSIDPNTGDYVFTPAEDFSGTASFQFTASDGDLSSPSTLVTITIPGVNDAPVLTATTASLPTITEDQTANNGQTIASFLSSTDADANALRGIALTGLTSGNGQWQYSTNAGSTWTAVGGVADGAALLLRSNDLIRFVPNGVDGTAADFTYRAWDQTSGTVGTKVDATANGGQTAFSTATGTASIVVSSVNDAPVLTSTSASLPTITEDQTTNNGQTIASFLSSTDADAGALRGIAISSLTSGNGQWQYSTNGGSTWTAVGGVADSAALLLRSSDLVRFVPNGLNGTTADFTYRAWDQSSGVVGTKVDATANGGQTAFSTATGTASIVVSSVNDAPVLTSASASLATITEDQTTNNGQTIASFLSSTDADAGALSGIALNGLTSGNGQWQSSTNGGTTWTPVGVVADGAALLLRSSDLIRFVPNGVNGTTANFTYRAWDQASGLAGTKVAATTNGGDTAFSTATGTASIVVSAVNDAPVGVPSSASGTEDGPPITGQVQATDVDNATLTYAFVPSSAVGGSVSINSTTGNYSFTPAQNFNGTASFRFTASDGSLTSAPATVTIAITGVNDAPVAVADSASTNQGTPVLINVLANDTDIDGNPLTIAAVGAAANGAVQIVSGQVRYTPNSSFIGNDSFSYTISDGAGGSAQASAGVTVAAAGVPTAVSVSFRQGANGYLGAVDTFLRQNKPTTSYADAAVFRPTTDGGKIVDALLRFDGLFGPGPGQIPVGSQIVSATLQIQITAASTAGGTLNRMLVGWNASSTWNSLGTGVQTDGNEATSSGITLGAVAPGNRVFDVTDSLVAWNAAGSTSAQQNAANLGWVFNPTNSDPWAFNSSQSGTQPVLTITYAQSSMPASLPTVSVSAAAPGSESSGKVTFNLSLSQAATQSVTVTFSTADHTAKSGSDYVGTVQSLTFLPGQTTKSFDVSVVNDGVGERLETFTVQINSATSARIDTAVAVGKISDNDVIVPPMPALNPTVVVVHNLANGTKYDGAGSYGIGDPSGLAYIPSIGTLFVADSEHDESPYNGNINLFALGLDGSYIRNHITSFTEEPTGLAYNPSNGYLYIADDDQSLVSWVSPTNPSVRLGSFDVGRHGFYDTEDLKFDPLTGHIHILDEQLFEFTADGTFVNSVPYPTVLKDAEALAYDSLHDLFFVAGGTALIYVMDAEGTLKGTISILTSYSVRPEIKGLELAPSSNPNDGAKLSLYVADYGNDQANDGRLFEINLGGDWFT